MPSRPPRIGLAPSEAYGTTFRVWHVVAHVARARFAPARPRERGGASAVRWRAEPVSGAWRNPEAEARPAASIFLPSAAPRPPTHVRFVRVQGARHPSWPQPPHGGCLLLSASPRSPYVFVMADETRTLVLTIGGARFTVQGMTLAGRHSPPSRGDVNLVTPASRPGAGGESLERRRAEIAAK